MELANDRGVQRRLPRSAMVERRRCFTGMHRDAQGCTGMRRSRWRVYSPAPSSCLGSWCADQSMAAGAAAQVAIEIDVTRH